MEIRQAPVKLAVLLKAHVRNLSLRRHLSRGRDEIQIGHSACALLISRKLPVPINGLRFYIGPVFPIDIGIFKHQLRVVLSILPLGNLRRVGKARPLLIIQGRKVLRSLVNLVKYILLVGTGPSVDVKSLLDHLLVDPRAAPGIRMEILLIQGFNIPVDGGPVVAVLVRQEITALVGEGNHGLGNQISCGLFIGVLHGRCAGRAGKVVHGQHREGKIVLVNLLIVYIVGQLVVRTDFLHIGNRTGSGPQFMVCHTEHIGVCKFTPSGIAGIPCQILFSGLISQVSRSGCLPAVSVVVQPCHSKSQGSLFPRVNLIRPQGRHQNPLPQ